MTPAETVLALVGGVGGLGTAISKVWDWWKTRDAAKLAAEAEAAKSTREHNTAERGDIVTLLQRQLSAEEARTEKSAARSEAIASALSASAAATRENSGAIDDLRGALTDHSSEELATLREVHTMLRALIENAPADTSRTSVVPGLRGPTPPRGIVANANTPPRKVTP